MRRIALPMMTVLMIASLSVHGRAELTPEKTREAEALIQQFAARRFPARQQAVKKLIEMGPDVLPLVRNTLAGTKDNEVKLRCGMVIKGIAEKYGVGIGTGKPLRRFGLDGSRVTMKLQSTSLERILGELARKSGNAFIEIPEDWENKPLSLDVRDGTYWQALDLLCTKAGLIYKADEKTGETTLHRAEDAVDLTAYAGPVVIKLDDGESSRWQGKLPTLDCRFSFMCEDGLQPIAAEVIFTKATGSDGVELKRRQARRTRLGHGRGGCINGTVYLAFKDLPAEMEKIDRLEGVVTLHFGSGRRTLAIEDVFGAEEKAVEADGVSLMVRGTGGGRGGVALRIQRTVGGKKTPLPIFAADGPYGAHLVGPNGNRHPGFVLRGNPGTSHVSPTDRGRRHVFFPRLRETKGKWTLVCVLPAKTTEKEFPFTFADVPLP